MSQGGDLPVVEIRGANKIEDQRQRPQATDRPGQPALHEIEEVLRRVDKGTYGVCEMSGRRIPHSRLKAIPFARFTVECQTGKSLFGLIDEKGGEGEEDAITDLKD